MNIKQMLSKYETCVARSQEIKELLDLYEKRTSTHVTESKIVVTGKKENASLANKTVYLTVAPEFIVMSLKKEKERNDDFISKFSRLITVTEESIKALNATV